MTAAPPPMDPNTDEASEPQLARAREQGDAYGRAVQMMVDEIAETGGTTRSGEYEVGYAIEEAEGLYVLSDGELTWNEPEDENVHVEIVVRDAADGRFIPGLEVDVTLTDATGRRLGPHRQELVWHPMMYHYARNWAMPDGEYTMTVEFQPPSFPRHDETNGRRFMDPCSVTFEGVTIKSGRG